MKIKHYARPIDGSVETNFEEIIIELFVALICAFFAYLGYQSKIPHLLYPTALLSIACWCSALFRLFLWLRHVLKSKLSEPKK